MKEDEGHAPQNKRARAGSTASAASNEALAETGADTQLAHADFEVDAEFLDMAADVLAVSHDSAAFVDSRQPAEAQAEAVAPSLPEGSRALTGNPQTPLSDVPASGSEMNFLSETQQRKAQNQRSQTQELRGRESLNQKSQNEGHSDGAKRGGEAGALEGGGTEGGKSYGASGLSRFSPDSMEQGSELLRSIEGIRSLLQQATYDEENKRFIAASESGPSAQLTMEPQLQRFLQRFLRRFRVPYAAVVAIEPSTGRILAVAEHGVEPFEPGHFLEAQYPAASIFKIVTGAALLEAGVSPQERICYHGGVRRLALVNLLDDPRRDHSCVTLADAMGYSVNAAFGKLALRELSSEQLRSVADRLFFNQPVPLLPGVEEVSTRFVSRAHIPEEEDQLDFGRTAAGFGDVTMSPMHGALLASALANGGLAAVPHLVGSLEYDGNTYPVPPIEPSRWVEEEVASSLTRMLEITVSRGTAQSAFRERRRPVLGDTRVAGKTGSLSVYGPNFRDYSWFIGYAPVEDPQIALGAVVVNPRKWVVKAPYLARETMRVYLSGR